MESILSIGLQLLASAIPGVGPFVPMIMAGIKYAPAIIAVAEETPTVIEAVRKAAPDLEPLIAAAAGALFHGGGTPSESSLDHVATAWFVPSRMTPEQEAAWMNAATPHNDPSEENSKFGG